MNNWDWIVEQIKREHKPNTPYPQYLIYNKEYDLFITAMSKEQANGHIETYFKETGKMMTIRKYAPDDKEKPEND